MIPRCSYPITSRRTCGTVLTGIYRYCPDHMKQQLANPYANDVKDAETIAASEEHAAWYGGGVEVEE
jgi:hypothetical protein